MTIYPPIFSSTEAKSSQIQLPTTEKLFFLKIGKMKKNRQKKITSFAKFLKGAVERHSFLLHFNPNPKSLVPVVQEVWMSKVEKFDLDLCQGQGPVFSDFLFGPSRHRSPSTQKFSAKKASKLRRYSFGQINKQTDKQTDR